MDDDRCDICGRADDGVYPFIVNVPPVVAVGGACDDCRPIALDGWPGSDR